VNVGIEDERIAMKLPGSVGELWLSDKGYQADE
jgi:hypothetical protein